MSFCTAINCMDGRTQLPVIAFLKERFGAEFVDMVTEAGPVGVLSTNPESAISKSILERVGLSLRAHGSRSIAVAAHHDCAGNPIAEAEQRTQLDACVRLLAERYPNVDVIGLWIDDTWSVCEPADAQKSA